MMTSCTAFNKILYTGIGGPPSESHSEISSADSDWSDIRTYAAKLGIANPDDLFTDRFKIDRQKLENMIKTETSSEGVNSAEEFFEDLMKTSKTYISWPCKLKIGAKSKKDPHVRIVGKQEDVQRAKERILAALDSRASRVIMKMDVSYTDHSFIIGRGGSNIKRIMEETATHIHFPDSNRSNPTEKSNQVSLCGSIEGVEKARSLVRLSTPILISFELPIMAPGRPIPDHDTPYIKEIETKYNVQVIFTSRPKLHSSLILVKGSEKEAAKVKEATQLLINYTCDNVANQILVNMQLEISPQHHEIVKGKNGTNLLSIMERTKTKIIFPDVNDMNIKPIKKSQITITGTIDGVYKARQQLIGNLPVVMIFDYPDNSADTLEVASLSNKYGVFILLRPKQRQNTIVVVIKGVEKFIDKVYEARHEILKLQGPIICPELPASYFSPKDKDMEVANRRNLTSLLSNHPESPMMSAFPMTQSSHVSPYTNCNPNLNGLHKFQGSPPGACTPNARFLHQDQHQHNLTHHQHHHHQQQQQQHPYNGYHANQLTNNSNNNGNNINGNINHSPRAGNGVTMAANYLAIPSHIPPPPPPSLQSTSPRSSGYQSFSSSTNSLEQSYPSGSYSSLVSTSRHQYSPDSNYEGGESRGVRDRGAGRRLSDGSMHSAGTNGNDYRTTPHYDMKQSLFDFDMKRVIGFKAMERAPHGELRTPTAHWAGLGISRTSPLEPTTNNHNKHHSDDTLWNRAQLSPYNLGVTTGLVESTASNLRLQLAQHKDIHSLLTSLGLEHYIKIFVLNEIDLDMFSTLTEDNLIELGITAFGARKKLLVAIHTLAVANSTGCSLNPNSSPRFSGSAAPGAERRTSSAW
ncbi:protein bicaudal C isoform X2 [Hermetia illucens]|nr:protein bicaudal C isoform X2 [Hermetia illucens]